MTCIPRKPVSSSSIKSVGYESSTETLSIEFTSGATYEFSAIPRTLYDDLMAAESKGRCFASTIQGKFPYRRLDESKRRKDYGASDSTKAKQLKETKESVRTRAEKNRVAADSDS